MTWENIRRQYLHKWLLLEAMQAHTEGNKLIVEDLAVLDTFPDSVAAIRRYNELHRAAPERELYVFHTDRAELDITERRWIGIRGLS
jgi:hypothetical protein